MTKNAKSMRSAAERAAEWYAIINHECVKTVRAMKTQFNRQDLFASDCVGKRADGSHVYIQVTAGQATAVTARKRKLEAIPWHVSDNVVLIQLVKTEDGYCFQENFYLKEKRSWLKAEELVPIPKEWFKAHKKEEPDGEED